MNDRDKRIAELEAQLAATEDSRQWLLTSCKQLEDDEEEWQTERTTLETQLAAAEKRIDEDNARWEWLDMFVHDDQWLEIYWDARERCDFCAAIDAAREGETDE